MEKGSKTSLKGLLGELDIARQPEVSKKLSQIPKAYKMGYLRAILGGPRSAAIKAFCLECQGWEKAEIKNCSARACPLWNFRPYQSSKEKLESK